MQYCSKQSELKREEGRVIRKDSSSDLQQVDQSLSLAGEAVDHVLFVVGNGRLEEEREVGEDGAHLLIVD